MRLGLLAIMGCASLISCAEKEEQTYAEKEEQTYTVLDDAIPRALTKVEGDAVRGQAIFLDREKGHCVLCHVVDGLDARFQGNVGPALNGIGSRFSPGQLRLRVVDYTQIDPNVIMPAYHHTDKLNQVGQAYEGKPVLTAQEIEDIVAYLMTLDGTQS